MKCFFCGRENIPLKFISINTGLKVYECICGHTTTAHINQEPTNAEHN